MADRDAVRGELERRLLHVIAPLAETPGGRLLYEQADSLVRELERSRASVEAGYGGVLRLVLDTLGRRLSGEDAARVEALTHLLAPPLSQPELDSLRALADGESPASESREDSLGQVLSDTLSRGLQPSIKGAESRVEPSDPSPAESSASEAAGSDRKSEPPAAESAAREREPSDDTGANLGAEHAVDSVYRQHLKS